MLTPFFDSNDNFYQTWFNVNFKTELTPAEIMMVVRVIIVGIFVVELILAYHESTFAHESLLTSFEKCV